jgi:hypothetical protein
MQSVWNAFFRLMSTPEKSRDKMKKLYYQRMVEAASYFQSENEMADAFDVVFFLRERGDLDRIYNLTAFLFKDDQLKRLYEENKPKAVAPSWEIESFMTPQAASWVGG